jgi:pimeloyl-ACP methyl ester carboxylesterase
MQRGARRIARAALLSGLATLGAQTIATGPRAATFHSAIDNSDQPYALYLPRSFDPSRQYPLVMSLHAEETNHSVNLAQLFGVRGAPFDIGMAVARGIPPLRDVDFIVACPFARGTMGYQGIAEQDVYDVLADVRMRYPIDQDRIYLTGISMGGGGALWLALTRPDVWAAVAPVCAATIPGSQELAPNALNLPIRMFQGALDPAVSPASSRDWQKRLLDAGDPAEYIEYPTVRHNAWDNAYASGSIFDWFAKYRRNPAPERVRLVARSYRYASAYWLRIDAMTPGVLASIDARLAGKTAMSVETRDVDAFSIAGPVLSLPAVVTVDRAVIRVRAGSPLSFVKVDGAWRQGQAAVAGKRAGSEGPIAAAVSSRHIYVYGTADNPSPAVLASRREAAGRAANWSPPGAVRLALTLPVKADAEVTDADIESANLVLLGSSETNSLIARFAGMLPLSLHSGAADYGLLFIAPVGRRYALVGSGLPWWTGAEEANRGGDPFAPPLFRLLTTFGDFILFRGSLANVVAEGSFDRNWKVPADASAKMLATGTVSVQP